MDHSYRVQPRLSRNVAGTRCPKLAPTEHSAGVTGAAPQVSLEELAACALWWHVNHRECCYAGHAWHWSSAGPGYMTTNSKHKPWSEASLLLQQPVKGAANKRSCADKMLDGAVEA